MRLNLGRRSSSLAWPAKERCAVKKNLDTLIDVLSLSDDDQSKQLALHNICHSNMGSSIMPMSIFARSLPEVFYRLSQEMDGYLFCQSVPEDRSRYCLRQAHARTLLLVIAAAASGLDSGGAEILRSYTSVRYRFRLVDPNRRRTRPHCSPDTCIPPAGRLRERASSTAYRRSPQRRSYMRS